MQRISINTLRQYLALACISLAFLATPTLAEMTTEQQQVIAASQQININQASAEQLTSLPGIGPVRATAILELREELGHFSSLQELQQVRGIGPATLESLEPLVSF